MNSPTGKISLFAFLFVASVVFNVLSAQTISVYKDVNQTITKDAVKSLDFEPYIKTINDGLNHAHYWFKIEKFVEDDYYIQITNPHITEAIAFKGDIKLDLLDLERFPTFKISNTNEPVYLKVLAQRESFIPIEVFTASAYHFKEKKELFYIGLYYGFALVILIMNLFYFFNFKDYTILYYVFFLIAITFGLLISDGVLRLFGASTKLIDFLETIDHFIVSVTAVLFASSFLQTENYYPKLKYFALGLVITIGILSICYLSSFNFTYYAILEVLVFVVCAVYIITAGFLFNKNNFSKIFLLAYIFILVLGFCYYVSKLLGFTLLEITSSGVKFGGIMEMLVLSFAVIYRMRTLQYENRIIRIELDSYIKEAKERNETLENETNENSIKENVKQLSFRETEILQLISVGKTNKEIALELHISENTVKYHVKNIYTKLNIKSRKEVASVINN
ncbi:LuxR C-terminal-related transcriptional regulator [Lacinutrix chionoecetis]